MGIFYNKLFGNVLQRNVYIIVLLGLGTFLVKCFVADVPMILKAGNYNKMVMPGIIVIGALVFLILPAVSCFVEQWKAAFWIEVFENKINGYSFLKKPIWEVEFKSIRSMEPSNFIKVPFSMKSMEITDEHHYRYLIAIDVEKFGALMELIKEKSVKIEKCDFSDWPNNKLVWKK